MGIYMSVYVYKYICSLVKCMYVHMLYGYINLGIWADIDEAVCVYTYECIYLSIYMLADMYICIYIHKHITYMHAYTHGYLCIYVSMHTGRNMWSFLCM